MQNTTKTLAAATCALAVTAVGGFWLYGIHAAGKSFDKAALTNFESVLPAEVTARVTEYQGGFFSKKFVVSLQAAGGYQLGSFQGEAYPGLSTKVVLTRAPDANFEQALVSGGVRGFDDRIELSYSLWSAMRIRALPLPSARLIYETQSFSVVSGGQCDVKPFHLDVETGGEVRIDAQSEGMVCHNGVASVFQVDGFSVSFVSQAAPIANALNGQTAGLGQSALTFNMGPMRTGALRHDGLEFKMRLEKEDKGAGWTETVDFSIEKPVSAALFLMFGEIASIDRMSGTMRVTGITERLSDQFSEIALGPIELQADLYTMALTNAIRDQGLAIELAPLSLTLNGVKSTLAGTIKGEAAAAGSTVIGRFLFEADDDIVPPDLIAEAVAQGYLEQENGKIRSKIVLTPDYGTVNSIAVY